MLFAALYAAEGTPLGVLADIAREFSPRIDIGSARDLVLDLNGLERLFGDARTMAEELRRTAADRGVRVRVAIAGTRTAARLIVRHRAGLTVIEPGTEAAALAALPLGLLAAIDVNSQLPTPNASAFAHGDPGALRRDLAGARHESPTSGGGQPLSTPNYQLEVFKRWGLRTLGDVVALPSDDLAARMGQEGVRWQRLARGEDAAPLVPAVPE